MFLKLSRNETTISVPPVHKKYVLKLTTHGKQFCDCLKPPTVYIYLERPVVGLLLFGAHPESVN